MTTKPKTYKYSSNNTYENYIIKSHKVFPMIINVLTI